MAARESYVINLMIAVDVLGNVLAGGSRWHTMSARTGYYAFVHGRSRGARRAFWNWLANVIDWSFKPLQGRNHCLKAWREEARVAPDIGRIQRSSEVGTVLVAVPIIFFCPLVYALNRVHQLSGIRLRNVAGW